jgi:RNA polymerase sigma-70 factor (ECF subfamily)
MARQPATRQAAARKPADDGLIAAAISGDRVALNDLLLSHFDRLHVLIERRLPARLKEALTVDDVVQETLVRAIRGIAHFEPRGDQSFSAWLDTLARHTMDALSIAHAAKKRGGQFRRRTGAVQNSSDTLADLLEVLTDDEETASTATAAKEAIRAVQVGIACLPQEQQQAVRLRYIQGQSVDETADALGRSPAAIRGLLYRAKRRLRTLLGRSSRWFSRK